MAVFIDELKRQICPHRRARLGQGLLRGLQQRLLDDLVRKFSYISLLESAAST